MFKSFLSTNPTFLEVILLLLTAIAMGVIFSLVYVKVKKMNGYHKDMPITFILLPTVVTALSIGIITITNLLSQSSSLITYERIGVAIIAALLVIRFRSELRNFEDLCYVFAFCGIGVVLGFGYLYFALLSYGLILLIVILVYAFKFPRIDSKRLNVKITVPEDLNYENIFDEVFKNKCLQYTLTKSKTSDLGSLFVVSYEVILKKEYTQKELIDDLRVRNGNLNIVATIKNCEDNL